MRTLSFLVALIAMTLLIPVARAGEEKYPDISIKDLKAAMEKHAVTLLDANGTESYAEGHIPGAIDFEASGAKLEKALPSDKHALIVAYCGGPQCMAFKSAAAKAEALGYTNVKHLSAGISGWKQAGEKTEKADKAAASASR